MLDAQLQVADTINMSEPETLLRQRVLDAVHPAEAHTFTAVLIDRGLAALRDMREMEETIYEVYVETGQEMWHLIDTTALLEALARRTLGGIRKLAALLDAERDMSADVGGDDDLEFDLSSEAEPSAGSSGEADLGLDQRDIDSALDHLAAGLGRSDEERLAVVRSQAEATGYGLRSQLTDFDARFAAACADGGYTLALRQLDDIRNALTDAVFALLSCIGETYLGKLDKSEVLPGHRGTLEKSIFVRKGLTELRRTINACNARIQDQREQPLVSERAFEHLARTLGAFLHGEVLRVMRPADRWEVERLGEAIIDRPWQEARLACEGLDKFLDSLVSINQREVLIQHDRELMQEIGELLDASRPLLGVSLLGAAQLVRDAFQKADALFGLRDSLDEVLIDWRLHAPDLETADEIATLAGGLGAEVSIGR